MLQVAQLFLPQGIIISPLCDRNVVEIKITRAPTDLCMFQCSGEGMLRINVTSSLVKLCD